jgi:hypothetical protein
VATEPSDPDGSSPADPRDVPGEVRLAAGTMLLQACGLVLATLVLLVKTAGGSADNLGRAFSDLGFAALGAVGLALAARALLRLNVSVRTPVLLLEVLALPVGYSLGIQAGRYYYGVPILVTAVAVIYLLFTPPARRIFDRTL